MVARSILYTAFMVAASPVEGFMTGNCFDATKRAAVASSSTTLKAWRRTALVTKEFQLEELEDRDECLTEVRLDEDGSVKLGQTNGPPVKEYQGDWHLLETASEEDRPFRMRLRRTYEAGSSAFNGEGELTYDIKREFWGNIEMVGNSVSVSGKTHGLDEKALVDCELGYFTLIDTMASEGASEEKN